MCYPCSHCGACKVKLTPGVCPKCKESVDDMDIKCRNCGFPLPMPPGQIADSMQDDVYVPPNMDDGRNSFKAEEFGVIGSWPVPENRPQL